MGFESYTPISFFSFHHYIIASPSSNQFIAIISFHQNEKATINHNLFSSLGEANSDCKRLKMHTSSDIYKKKKSNDTIRFVISNWLETLRNHLTLQRPNLNRNDEFPVIDKIKFNIIAHLFSSRCKEKSASPNGYSNCNNQKLEEEQKKKLQK